MNRLMKFSTTVSDLSSCLALAARAVPSRPSHPILGCVLITADAESQEVAFVGYDLSQAVSLTTSAIVYETGAIAVPAKLLTALAAKLPDCDEVVLEFKDDQLHVKAGRSKYKLGSMDAVDYPALPWDNIDATGAIQIDTEEFRHALNGVIGSASNDTTKAILQGVLVHCPDGLLSMAATDGHRCSIATTSIAAEAPPAIIPASALKTLDKLIQKTRISTISYAIDGSSAIFIGDNGLRVSSRLLDGTYPNLGQLFAGTFERLYTINPAELTAALERLALVTDFGTVKLAFNGSLEASADGRDVGQGVEVVDIGQASDGFVVALSSRYLVEALRPFTSETITMAFNGPLKPMLVYATEEIKTLLMPIQLRG